MENKEDNKILCDLYDKNYLEDKYPSSIFQSLPQISSFAAAASIDEIEIEIGKIEEGCEDENEGKDKKENSVTLLNKKRAKTCNKNKTNNAKKTPKPKISASKNKNKKKMIESNKEINNSINLKEEDGIIIEHKEEKIKKKKVKKDNKEKKELKDTAKKGKEAKVKDKKDKVKKESKETKNASKMKSKETKNTSKKALKSSSNNKGEIYYLMNKNTKLFDTECEEFLKGKCNNNYCKYIHNPSKLYKSQNNLEFCGRYETLFQDFQVLSPYTSKFFSKASLDLMFIMDCTSSMAPWINKCVEELNNIISLIKEKNPHSPINISFIGYRDYDRNRFRLLSHPFTKDTEKMREFISKILCFGGADFPEDLIGGLNLGLQQSWSSKAKYAIIVTDAPCHGKKYHDIYCDMYPDKDPSGLVLEDLIREYAKRNIFLSAVSINDTTDKMYKIISDCYKEVAKRPLNIAKLGTSTDKFAFVVAFGASTTLSSVTMGNLNIREFFEFLKQETILNINEVDNDYENDDNKNINIDFLIKTDTSNNFNSIVNNSNERANNNNNNISNITNKVTTIKNKTVSLQDIILRVNNLMGQDQAFDNSNSNYLKISENASNDNIFDEPNKDKGDELINIFYDLSNINHNKLNTIINWDNLSKYTINSTCYSFTIPKDRNNSYINWKNPLIVSTNIRTQIQISDMPFAEGAMRYAFHMKDIDLDQRLVGKVYKKLKNSENNLKHFSNDILSITICRHIAYDFNDRIINIVPDTRLMINFVNAFVYKLDSYVSNIPILSKQLPHHKNFISVENYIAGDYSKYNNNSGWINDSLSESSMIAQAFSHFSWQFTKGYMMIVDLQGVDNIFTDPQIHCIDQYKFGKGNLGYVGIMKFFMSHICNSYCQHLKLLHPREYYVVDENYDFFVDNYAPPENPEKLIYKICDLCKNVCQIKAKELYDKKKKCWDTFCDPCDKKRKDTFKFKKCSKCHHGFKSSSYLFMMKREPFPSTCQKCKIDEGILERKLFDGNNIE